MFALYHLDVYVTQLTLNKETYTDTGGSPLVVKIVFLNFPALEVAERNKYHIDDDENDIYVYEFFAGRTFHFPMACEELVKKMKKVPLHIGVFRENDDYPVCQVRTYVNGCACDLGTLCVEKPKPLIFRGPFELTDPGKNFSGRIEMEIMITNMERLRITHYALAVNSFLYKGEGDEVENHCCYKEVSNMSSGFGDDLKNIDRITMQLDMTSPSVAIRDLAGISPAAMHLAIGRPPPEPPREPLVDPTASKRGKKKRNKKK